jgi:methionyl-tRNA formyltransferase
VRFVFAGTPDFAARVLTHLDDIGRRPCLVVSQPDRPKGRGQKTSPPEAIEAAKRLGIPHVQVDDINSPQSIACLTDTGSTTLVVAAFGQILRPALLERFLCLNVHGSLLPAFRGAAPIERAIAAGEPVTGVSIMRMAEGLDEGPWALQSTLSIGRRDDAGSIALGLAVLGANGVDQTLTGIADGNVVWTEQGEGAVYAAKLTSADTALDVSWGAAKVHDQVRSLCPGLGARAASGGLGLKIWRTWPYGISGLEPVPVFAREVDGTPGRFALGEGRLFIGCGEGAVEVLLLQPAGKGKMLAADFLRGYSGRLGDALDLPEAARSGSQSSKE